MIDYFEVVVDASESAVLVGQGLPLHRSHVLPADRSAADDGAEAGPRRRRRRPDGHQVRGAAALDPHPQRLDDAGPVLLFAAGRRPPLEALLVFGLLLVELLDALVRIPGGLLAERLRFLPVLRLDLGPDAVQEAEDVLAVVHAGQFLGRVPVDVQGEDVAVEVDEERDDGLVALGGRQVKGRVAEEVGLVRVTAGIRRRILMSSKLEIFFVRVFR